MKKAIKINLGGFIFHIDEDAYEKLQRYLASLSSQFGNGSEAKEILSDVEARIAELFQAKITGLKQVIVTEDIDNVIEILGKPSDYETEPSQTGNGAFDGPNYQQAPRRRFYRDVDNSVFGGVCSGIAAYFNMDPVIVRILFVLFFFIGGSTIIIYAILWIALPAARTAAQKLEMRGENITIDNIEKTIKQEYEQVKENLRKGNTGGRFRNFIDEFFHVLAYLIKGILKIFGIILGVLLTLIGICLIIAFALGAFGHPWIIETNNIHLFHLPFLAEQFMSPAGFSILVALFILLIGIPIVGMLYLGLKLIFKFKFGSRYFWLATFATWLISLILLIGFVVSGVRKIDENNAKTSTFKIDSKAYKILYLRINPKADDSQEMKDLMTSMDHIKYYISKQKQIFGRPRLIIEKTFDENGSVNIERLSRGSSYENALDNAKNISYDAVQKDSLLLLDPYFELPINTKWRGQQIEIMLKLPKGTIIEVDKGIEPILKDADISENLWTSDLIGKTWIMGEDGLKTFPKK
jgi:phage shock protein PspC (stress-responsive transcriptional regulator)